MIKLARYIRDDIEPKLPGLGWEQAINRDSKHFSGFSLIGLLATSGLIVVSQILAITVGWVIKMKYAEPDALVGLLQITALIATAITLILLFTYSRMKR